MKTLILLVAFTLGLSSVAYAAPVPLTDAGGQYIGFDGIEVGGTLFNVRFKDGSFNALFGGVPQFTTEAEAAAVSTALLIAIEGVAALDAEPFKMFGCGLAVTMACYIQTSDAELSALPDDVDVVRVRNGREADFLLNGIEGGLTPATSDTSTDNIGPGGVSSYVWADWTRASVSPLPVPSTLLLLGFGLAGVGFFGRTRRKDDKPKA